MGDPSNRFRYGVHNEVGGYTIVLYFQATMVNNKKHYFGCFC